MHVHGSHEMQRSRLPLARRWGDTEMDEFKYSISWLKNGCPMHRENFGRLSRGSCANHIQSIDMSYMTMFCPCKRC